MAPPAKRRKRNVVESSPQTSDNDEEEPVQVSNFKRRMSDLMSSSPPRPTGSAPAVEPTTRKASQILNPPATRAKTANHPHNAAPIYPSTHQKARRTAKVDEKRKNADIHALFTKQAQRQDKQSRGETIPKQRIRVLSSRDVQEVEDIISDDDDVGDNKAQAVSLVGQAAKGRVVGRHAFTVSGTNAPSASQKFVKPAKTSAEPQEDEDMRPWAEKFGPTNLEELGVHKRKVADVRTWLDNVIEGRIRQRLLILKGAAGTGKTTTLQLLAKDMGCDVLEWRNPVGSIATADGFQSMAAQFEEFMGRGGKFGQLDLFSDNGIVPPKPEPKPLDRRKQIILIEEFPNTFTRSSNALESFRSTVLQYLASNTPPLSMPYNHRAEHEPVTPVVMVISETLLTTTSASADSFTAHRLLGPEILQHPGVGVIEFNAIAPTILAKALETIVQKESRKSGRRKTPGPQVLKKLGEVGDIRSAIGSLEFMCLRGDVDDWGGKVVFGKAQKTSKDTSLTRMEEESLELITHREASLGIFHAVGKVVYNKREGRVPGDVENLSGFISHHARPKKSEVHVDELIDETGTDTQTFIAALHENYILSCDAPATSFEFSSLDHVNGCINALSDSDLLCSSWDGSFQSSGLGGGFAGSGSGGDVLRQDEITFHIAVRGLLFSLPHPVTRKAPSATGLRTGKAGDQHKMFYPTSLKLWRMKEEIGGTIDLWTTRLMKGEMENMNSITAGAAAFARPKAGTVESWKTKNGGIGRDNRSKGAKQGREEDDVAPLLSLGAAARTEMLLERLPYMVHIAQSKARKRGSSTLGFAIRDMEKVTMFKGIGNVGESADDDGDVEGDAENEGWTTDRPGEGAEAGARRKKGVVMRKGEGGKAGLLRKQEVVKYVLSDDDIEDD
ncbi:RFC checkpoint protein Rad17 [Clarireedia jacksonii]